MATHSPDLPTVFHALSDSTRFAVIERLSRGPASVSELAAPYAMAGPSFLKHLKVLEAAGLVRTRKIGRVRTAELAPETMRQVEDWVREHRLIWERRLDALGRFLDRDIQ